MSLIGDTLLLIVAVVAVLMTAIGAVGRVLLTSVVGIATAPWRDVGQPARARTRNGTRVDIHRNRTRVATQGFPRLAASAPLRRA